ncbi:MAG TPA: magnesium transporter CorA family protein [Gemmatimonadaceae bacterium]|nr:magnesium transporter CorA family protein [Gemmatimonadaceae bacterium]
MAKRQGPPRTPRLRKRAGQKAILEESRPRSWYRDAAGALRRDLDPREFASIVASGTGTLWVDINVASRHQHALLEKVFRFHPLSVEDALSAEGRVKVEEFPSYALVVVRGVRFMDETTDRYDIETFNLNCFLGRNFVVTAHGQHAPGVEATVDRLVRTAAAQASAPRDPSGAPPRPADDLLGRGPARLLHQILDGTVDAYFPIIDQLDEFVDGLEERVFVKFDQDALRDIFSVKRLVLQLRRHLAPMREVFNTMQSRPSALIPPETQLYFRDIYDHVIRLNESLDSYRDLLSSTLDSYLTQVSNRMGLVTKGLTVVATLSVPFVVVSGMWGMNLAGIPLAQSPYGFWVMLGLQAALGAGLIWVLKRRGWL